MDFEETEIWPAKFRSQKIMLYADISDLKVNFDKTKAVLFGLHPPPPPPHTHTLQTLVYDILSSTTAVFSYAIGSRKLSSNEQFFVVDVVAGGAQTVVSLLQTTQMKQGVSFIAANKVYTSTNKTTIV